MSKGTQHRTARVDDDLWLPAKAKADAEGVNLSEVIRAALRAYVEGDNAKAEAWDEAWARAVFWNKDLREVDEPNPYTP